MRVGQGSCIASFSRCAMRLARFQSSRYSSIESVDPSSLLLATASYRLYLSPTHLLSPSSSNSPSLTLSHSSLLPSHPSLDPKFAGRTSNPSLPLRTLTFICSSTSTLSNATEGPFVLALLAAILPSGTSASLSLEWRYGAWARWRREGLSEVPYVKGEPVAVCEAARSGWQNSSRGGQVYWEEGSGERGSATCEESCGGV